MNKGKKCWCGSGKTCDTCLKSVEGKFSVFLKEEYIAKYIRYLSAQIWFKDLTVEELDKYYLKKGDDEFNLESQVFEGVVENLVFEADIYGSTPLKLFFESPKIPSHEIEFYKKWVNENVLSIFEVVDVDLGTSITLADLRAKRKRYIVFEPTQDMNIRVGHCICCRLVPIKGHYVVVGGFAEGMPKHIAQKILKNFRVEKEQITGTRLMRLMYGKETEEGG